MARKRSTGLHHEIQWYSETYKIPLQTIINAHKRHWPLDDPAALYEKLLNAPGKRPDLRGLEAHLGIGQRKSKAKAPPVDEPEHHAGLKHEFERLTEECRRSFAEFRAEPSPSARISLQKIYLANVQALRQLAPVVTASEVEAKALISAADVEATWTRALQELKSELEQIAPRCARAPWAASEPVLVQESIKYEIDVALAHLSNSEPPDPPVAYAGPSNGCAPEMVPYYALREELIKKYGSKDTKTWSEADLNLLKTLSGRGRARS